MPLQPHPLDLPVELAEIGIYWQAGFARPFPVVDEAIQFELFFPANERIAQQRSDVIAQRSIHRVLEVEYAGIRLTEHQVARHEIAQHEDLRLGKRALNETRN